MKYFVAMDERQPIIIHLSDKDKLMGIGISGRRYTGKDTFASFLNSRLKQSGILSTQKSTALALKIRFCQLEGLDEQRFLNDRGYKELYRNKFSAWVQTQSQAENFHQFMHSVAADFLLAQVIIISDLRSNYDYGQFSYVFPVFLSIRLTSSEEVRKSRGFVPSAYDNTAFEKGIESIPYDYIFKNEGTQGELREIAAHLGDAVSDHFSGASKAGRSLNLD
jgi:phosphomevalonate kinase